MNLLKLRRVILLSLLLLVFLPGGLTCLWAQTTISKEYQIKAVFLFNFAQFVNWPATAFTRADEPFCIGILGDDPFGDFLDQTVRGEKVNGHPLIVERYAKVEDVKDCQILFISRSEMPEIKGVFSKLKNKSVLTVGDEEGFIQKGGILRFATKGNKIHLKINPEAAKRVKLCISSKVLRLADIVTSEVN